MSSYVSKDVLPDLWEEILQAHWTFLETEESIQKIEERKKLEANLKEFLCIVPHDRKFFLPETAHVLKKSIVEMKDFSAYKAMIGFESISQYANNLFTKPWRKEYRIIKMYSGFYQHEIKSNLVDADKLFKAMGYKQLNQILMLDGPICPDQVTNVSRDALAAYVECQIMKDISSGLKSIDLSCSWLDIYNFRKHHTGDSTQGVKLLACFLHERKNKKDKLYIENFFSMQSPQTINPTCPTCSHDCNIEKQHHQQISSNNCNNIYNHALTSNSMALQQQQQQQQPLSHQQQKYSSIYNLYSQPKIYAQQKIINPMNYYSKYHTYHHTSPLPIPHSNNYEHFIDSSPYTTVVPQQQSHHRHLLDQLHYDTNLLHYDYVDGRGDGGINNSFDRFGYNHPSSYNVSNNRYHHPISYNLSGQLNSQLQSEVNVNGIGGGSSSNGINTESCVNIINHSSLPLPPPPPPRTCNTIGNGRDSNKIGNGIMTSSNQKINSSNSFSNHLMITDQLDKNMVNCRHQCNLNNYSTYKSKNSNKFNGDFDERLNNSNCIQDQHQYQQQLCSSYDNDIVYNDRSSKLRQNHFDITSRLNSRDLNNHEKIDADDIDDCNHYFHNGGLIDENKLSLKKLSNNYKYVQNNPEMLKQYQKLLDNIHKTSDNSDMHPCNDYNDDNDDDEIISKISDDIHLKTITNGNKDNSKQKDLKSSFSSSNNAILNKNQDGVGSFESWDYVFQNLEKHGYNKDLNEKNDLLVQGLDLDSLNINGAVDKRRSRNIEKKSSTAVNEGILINPSTLNEKQNLYSIKRNSTISLTNQQNLENKINTKPSTIEKLSHNSGNSFQREEKHTGHEPNLMVDIPNNINNNNNSSNSNNNNNINNNDEQLLLQNALHKLPSNGILVANHCQQQSIDIENVSSSNSSSLSSWPPKPISASNNTSSSVTVGQGNVVTQTSTTASTASSSTTVLCGPNEWSCRFCTFLNSDAKRICEMCCRSKDFNLDTTNTPTYV